MQTKSQNAQNPGLWVNGNRMPMHEQQTQVAPSWMNGGVKYSSDRSFANQTFPAINASENEAAAKKSFVDKANKIGAEGISPYFGSGKYPAGYDQETQNTQAYGSGENLRWVDPAGAMHRGEGQVNDRPGTKPEERGGLQTYLDNSPIMRAEIEGPRLGTPTYDKGRIYPVSGYNPHGSRGFESLGDGAYSIIDNPNASYGTDDPITRSIRATASKNNTLNPGRLPWNNFGDRPGDVSLRRGLGAK